MDVNLGACYYDHFSRFFREPCGRSVFHPQDENLPSIQILEYDHVFQGCRVFCSLGLTHHQEELGGVVEVMLPVDDGWEDAPYVLANGLHYMIRKRRQLKRGSCLSGVENILPRFAETFGKTALYLSLPYGLPDDFVVVCCGDTHGTVYLAAFISQAEYDFLARYGPDEFEDILVAKHVDPFNLRRPSSL